MATPAVSAPVFRRRHPLRAARPALLGALGVVGFLATWELVPALGLVRPESFPGAIATLARLGAEAGDLEFWRNVGRTLTAWGIGLALAIVLALVLGTLVGMIPLLRRLTQSTVEFLRPIPSVALIPLAILSFGMRIEAALVIIVFASFWQVFVQVLYGVADVDTVARDTARSFSLTRGQVLRSVVLPTALPYLMTGARLAASVALVLAITAEMTINNPGLGLQLMVNYNNGDQTGVFAVVIVAGAIGVIVNLIFGVIERRTLFWHQSVRGEETS